jgi:MSHA biogenesis protein MshJ
MMTQISSMTQWYDGRPVRDRAVLLIGAVFVIVFLIFYLLVNPWGRKNDRVIQQISTLKTEMADLQAKEQVISARKDFDPDSKDLKLLGVLLEESAKLEQQLQEGIVNLVTPREMPQVLKELLTQQDDLQLISLENLVPQQLKFDRKETPDEFSPILYRHSLGMTFSGNYLTLLKYLKQLEQLPRTLIWEEVEILSENYPQATVRLQVYTLSLKEGWIGG